MLLCRIEALTTALAVLLGLAGCRGGFKSQVEASEREFFTAPDGLEILTLEPPAGLSSTPLPPGVDGFHGFRVLGRAGVEAPDERAELVGLVRRGIDEAGDAVAACFLPRHGLRILQEERTLDLVVCFECFQIRMYGRDGERVDVRTDDAVEPEVSRLFRAHGLTIAAH